MDNDLETTEEAFDAIPEEVQQYIYSDEFDALFTALCDDIAIDAEKRILLKGALFGFIAQIEDEENLLDRIKTTSDDIVKQQKIKTWINTNVTQKLLALITDAYVLEAGKEDEETVPVEGTPTITPTALATLADRLKQASIATPAKHDYSIDTEGTSPKTISSAIDPYHEAIDNE